MVTAQNFQHAVIHKRKHINHYKHGIFHDVVLFVIKLI